MNALWSQDLATAISDIDLQHQELFRHMETLLLAWSEGTGPEKAGEAIRYLAEYVVFHFGTEEIYMEQFDYPGKAGHIAEHEAFKKNFEMLKNRYLQAGPDELLVKETNILLVDWFINHIKNTDKALGDFLVDKI